MKPRPSVPAILIATTALVCLTVGACAAPPAAPPAAPSDAPAATSSTTPVTTPPTTPIPPTSGPATIASRPSPPDQHGTPAPTVVVTSGPTPEHPSTDTASSSPTSTSLTATTTPESAPSRTQTPWEWFLSQVRSLIPKGDDTLSGNEDVIYGALLKENCSFAQTYLDDAWIGFGGPRNVVLFQAATHLCAGRTDEARREWARVTAYPPNFGSLDAQENTVARWSCGVYRTLGHVLEDQPLDEFRCGTEPEPPWAHNDRTALTDPRATRSTPNPLAPGPTGGADLTTTPDPKPTSTPTPTPTPAPTPTPTPTP